MRTRAASGVVGARHTRPVRHGRPGRTQRLLAILATIITTGLIGAAAGATSEQAARHYFGSDPVELGLARAVATGNAHQVSWLVAHGADPDSVGADNITMLQWAIEARSPDGLQALLAAGALRDRLGRAGRAPMHDAARLADPRYVQILLAAGADPDVRVPYTQTTPLREACLASEPATLEELVAGGADLEATDTYGDRALHVCARTDSGAMVLRLLDLGADPRARNAAGNTFQDYYFSFHEPIVKLAARQQHRRTAQWLQDHNIQLVADAEEYR